MTMHMFSASCFCFLNLCGQNAREKLSDEFVVIVEILKGNANTSHCTCTSDNSHASDIPHQIKTLAATKRRGAKKYPLSAKKKLYHAVHHAISV